MSLDFQIAHSCPHLTVEEVVALNPDRRSLFPVQPVASQGVVRILVNNEFLIPQGGLYAPARLFSGDSGPFDLTEGDDTLTVRTSAGTQTISLGVSGQQRLSTDDVIRRLQGQGFNIALVENVDGRLVFTDQNTLGPESQVKVSGSVVTSFGFGDPLCGSSRQYGARGRMIYPPWRLLNRPDSNFQSDRYPQFIYPVRTNPTFKVTYAVPVQRCRRCRATYVENDFRFDASGQGILIGNENLLYQATLKILLTDRGSNPYHPWYGTALRSRIGSKAVSSVSAAISEDVRTALSNFQSVQREQGQYQPTTLKERLYRVLEVNVRPHEADPTTFLLDVSVQNQSSEPISLSIVFTVPEVVAVMGTNGLTLGTEIAGVDTLGV